MKYKTFRALALGGGVVLAGGGVFGLYHLLGGRSEATAPTAWASGEPVRTPVTSAEAPSKTPTSKKVPPAAAPPAYEGLGAMEKQILARFAEGMEDDKVKDAFKGERYKVNLYRDPDGKLRAKVDLDRDEKWDEKWTFERVQGQDKVKRQISSRDDETYDQELRLDAGKWVKK
jgi:hypothetical protein